MPRHLDASTNRTAIQDSTAKTYSIPRYTVSLVRDSRVATPTQHIRSSRDARDVLAAYLAGADREHFVVLLLDTKKHIIGIHTVSTGSLAASIVHPREVLKACILSNADAYIAGHNHPSGECTPSQEDRAITARLKEASALMGIALLDHIILGDGTETYYSFADHGDL